MYKLTRRHFITATTAVVAMSSIAGLYVTRQKKDSADVTAVKTDPAMSKNEDVDDNFSQIGKVYLEQQELSPDKETRKLLLSKIPGMDQMNNIEEIFSNQTQLKDTIRGDIQQQKLCFIDGWQLTETECIVGAIAYIERGVKEEQKYQNIPFDFPQETITSIEAWGPQKTAQSQPFNLQSDGNSALWIKTEALPGTYFQVYFGKYPTKTTIHASGLITADLLPAESLEATQEKGVTPIFLVNTRSKTKQEIGSFTVTAAEGDISAREYLPCYEQVKIGVLAKVIAWGPKTTKLGHSFNLQPDNSSAFWIKINKKNKGDYTVALGNIELETHNHDKKSYELLTASVADYVAAALVHKTRQIPLFIISGNKKQMVGLFSVK